MLLVSTLFAWLISACLCQPSSKYFSGLPLCTVLILLQCSCSPSLQSAYVAGGVFHLEGEALRFQRDVNFELLSSGPGFTLDAQLKSRVVEVRPTLTLLLPARLNHLGVLQGRIRSSIRFTRVHLTRGSAHRSLVGDGGCVFIVSSFAASTAYRQASRRL